MRHVNPHEAPTELAAAWYAANYYYKASFLKRKEYAGWIFKKPNGKFGLTVRVGSGFDRAAAIVEDVPQDRGGVPTAIWHTHLPYDALAEEDIAKIFARALDELGGVFGVGWEDFSAQDIKLSRAWTEVGLKKLGRKISIYLVTATLIKRFTPGASPQIKSWPKDPPGHFKAFPL